MCRKFLGIWLILSALAVSGIAEESNYLYMQANFGYANQPWEDVFGSFAYPDGQAQLNWSRGDNNLTYGFNIGYHPFKCLGIEAGYFGIPLSRLTSDSPQEYGFSTAEFYANDAYLAMRALGSLADRLQIFTKIGVEAKIISGARKAFNQAWQYKEPTAVGPIFAAGLQYMIYRNFGLNLQYTYLGGRVENINTIQGGATSINPNAQLVTLGLVFHIFWRKKDVKTDH
ncbi:MAG: hypothetical protein WCF19_06045 [Chlamydiales bacterium]